MDIDVTEQSGDGISESQGSKDDVKKTLDNFRSSLVNDVTFRKKFLRTAVLCWSLLGSGWVLGMQGPTFLDLSQIINEDLTRSTLMFTLCNFGYLIGSLGGGILFDRVNRLGLLAIESFGLVVSQCVTPFCTSLSVMLVARFFVGLFGGGIDTSTQADIYYVWGSDGGPYMQALHFTYSVGSLIAPLVTEPFLANKLIPCNSTNLSNGSMYNITTPGYGKVSYTPKKTNESEICQEIYEKSRVHTAFIISGVVCASAGVCFISMCFKSCETTTDEKQTESSSANLNSDEEIHLTKEKKQFSIGLKIFFLCFVCILLAASGVAEDNFGNLLMTFTTLHLHWTKSDGAIATAANRIALTLARLVCVFLTAYGKHTLMLAILQLLMLIGFLGFYAGAVFNSSSVIWIFTVFNGISVSAIYPTLIIWTSENVIPAKGWVISVLVTFCCVCNMVIPTIVGNLMENVDTMWFIYHLLIVQGFSLVTFAFLVFAVRFCAKGKRYVTNDKDVKRTEMSLMDGQ